MADVITSLLQILLIGDGLHEDTWGGLADNNWAKLELAICGKADVNLTAQTDLVLTDDQARPYFMNFVGAPAGPVNVTVPARTKRWSVSNTTGQLVTLLSAGAAFSVPPNVSAVNVTLAPDGSLTSGSDVVIGVMQDFAGIELPSGNFAWANGAALPRAAYASLFNIITKGTTGTGTTGTPTMTAPADLTKKGLLGAAIEGIGIPTGTVVSNITVSAGVSTLTLSNNLTGTVAGTPIRLFPFGNGDGATTFNLPNRSQRVSVGRGDMGGVASPGLITAFSATTAKGANGLGSTGGVESVALTAPQNGPHTHGLTDPGHLHTGTTVPHTHTMPQFSKDAYFGAVGGGGLSIDTNGGNVASGTGSTTPALDMNNASTGLTVQSAGAGDAHANMPPFFVCNVIIRVN